MNNPEKKKVYIVEDDVLLGKILTNQFESSNLEVTLITSGDKALKLINSKPPDAVLLDIFLPGMDGLTLLAELRKNEATKDLIVLIISNSDQLESREKAKELNAEFLTKAITSPDDIVDITKKRLGIL